MPLAAAAQSPQSTSMDSDDGVAGYSIAGGLPRRSFADLRGGDGGDDEDGGG